MVFSVLLYSSLVVGVDELLYGRVGRFLLELSRSVAPVLVACRSILVQLCLWHEIRARFIFFVFRSIGSFSGLELIIFRGTVVRTSSLITVWAGLTVGSVEDFLEHRQIFGIDIVSLLFLSPRSMTVKHVALWPVGCCACCQLWLLLTIFICLRALQNLPGLVIF